MLDRFAPACPIARTGTVGPPIRPVLIFSVIAHRAITQISHREGLSLTVRALASAGCPKVGVPTVHRFGPYRFFFYSDENRGTHEPPHIHVQSGNGEASFWLLLVRRREYWGYTPREVDRIRRLVLAHRPVLLRAWHDFFDE
jgi:Domain of unknown function (DUF4160)